MKDEVTNILRLANFVRENMRKKRLLTPYHTLLVTLSGGQDSICSLFLLYLLQNQITPKTAVDSGLSPRSVSRRQKISKRSENLLSGAKTQLSTETLICFCSRARLIKPKPLCNRLTVGNSSHNHLRRCDITTYGAALYSAQLSKAGSGRFRPVLPNMENLFDRCVFFEKSVRLIGHFGLLWCNHFWQRDSFHTMLHVAKVNLCFSSTMCFYLPIESLLCEQNAREWRHKSIQRTCVFFHYESCTQGHTKSDRVETILFNILRGTGIAGLQALRWKKSFYSFSCQRFYPRLSSCKLNWPQLPRTQRSREQVIGPTAKRELSVSVVPPLLKLTQALYKTAPPDSAQLSKAGFVKVEANYGRLSYSNSNSEQNLRFCLRVPRVRVPRACALKNQAGPDSAQLGRYRYRYNTVISSATRFSRLHSHQILFNHMHTVVDQQKFNKSPSQTKFDQRSTASIAFGDSPGSVRQSLSFGFGRQLPKNRSFSKSAITKLKPLGNRPTVGNSSHNHLRCRAITTYGAALDSAPTVGPELSKAGSGRFRPVLLDAVCLLHRELCSRPEAEHAKPSFALRETKLPTVDRLPKVQRFGKPNPSWPEPRTQTENKFSVAKRELSVVMTRSRSGKPIEYSIDRPYYNQLKLIL
jgi:hypothetical protein